MLLITTLLVLSGWVTLGHTASGTVNCQGPTNLSKISKAESLPSSEGILYCSSLLGKYTTSTSTSTIVSAYESGVDLINVIATAPAPTVTAVVTSTTTLGPTATDAATATATSTITAYPEVEITVTVTSTSFKPVTTTTITTSVKLVPSNYHKRSYPPPKAAVKKRDFDFASTVGIASSNIPAFCACIATGSTSTATVITTLYTSLDLASTVTTTRLTITPPPVTVTSTGIVTAYAPDATTFADTTTVESTLSLSTLTITYTSTKITISPTTVATATAQNYRQVDFQQQPLSCDNGQIPIPMGGDKQTTFDGPALADAQCAYLCAVIPTCESFAAAHTPEGNGVGGVTQCYYGNIQNYGFWCPGGGSYEDTTVSYLRLKS